MVLRNFLRKIWALIRPTTINKSPEGRNFDVVLDNIKALLPAELREELRLSATYWPPELRWYKLSQWVNGHVEPSSSNDISISIYSKLCNCSLDEMKSRFERDGF